jgi:hypothetical protein
VRCETDAIIIAKRDGSFEPLRVAKLRRCLMLAMRSCHCDVAQVADALVEAVACHLREWDRSEPPTSAYLYRCACTVLRQTGLGEAARRLAGHRRQRVAQRRRVGVFDPRGLGDGTRPWRKALVVAALEHRYGLTRPVARILAGEIEARVFALKYRLIAKPLLDELIRNELAAWGLVVEATGESRGVTPHASVASPEPRKEK